jgi:hypothetical protein
MIRHSNNLQSREPTCDVPPIGPVLPPAEIARRMFNDLRGQGMTPQQIRRIALALICETDAPSSRPAK